jgi:hypothetical protein
MRLERMPSRSLLLLLALGFTLGCSPEGDMGADESEQRARMRAYLQSPEYRKAVEEQRALMEKEKQVKEDAEWIGQTGLPEDLERELPRYLRRELGESLFDEGSLKAADLTYVGSFPEGDSTVHYWRVPYRQGLDVYAYIEVFRNGDSFTEWGNRKPPSER